MPPSWLSRAGSRAAFFCLSMLSPMVASFFLRYYSDEAPVNLGSGQDVSLAEVANLVAAAIDYRGELLFDVSTPDGMFRNFPGGSKIAALGRRTGTSLSTGLAVAHRDFMSTAAEFPPPNSRNRRVKWPGN
jgi:hypothetical protein